MRRQIPDNVVTALAGLSTTGSRVYASRVYPMAGQARAKWLAEINTHLDTLGDDELDRRLRQYQRASGRLRMDKTNHRRRGR